MTSAHAAGMAQSTVLLSACYCRGHACSCYSMSDNANCSNLALTRCMSITEIMHHSPGTGCHTAPVADESSDGARGMCTLCMNSADSETTVPCRRCRSSPVPMPSRPHSSSPHPHSPIAPP